MDSHYDQVMKKRENAQAGDSILYFGYSTVLDRAAFDEWKAQHGYDFFSMPAGELAEGVDLGLIFDFPSRWWGGRVAGLEDKPGAKIYGVVFQIAPKDWPIIQHKEGAVTGMSVERKVKVSVGGEVREAVAFTTNPVRRSLDGPVSDRFLEAWRRGAEAAGLPAEYRASLGR